MKEKFDPTPAHRAFREKRAEIYAKPFKMFGNQAHGGKADAFLEGMAAEHEVAYTMGGIMILEAALKRHNRENIDNFLTENLEVAQERLAALLEGK